MEQQRTRGKTVAIRAGCGILLLGALAIAWSTWVTLRNGALREEASRWVGQTSELQSNLFMSEVFRAREGKSGLPYEEKDLAAQVPDGTELTRVTDTLWQAAWKGGPSYLFSTDPAIFAARSREEVSSNLFGTGPQFVVFAATISEEKRGPKEPPRLYLVCNDTIRFEVIWSAIPPVPGCLYVEVKSDQAELRYPPKAAEYVHAFYPECYAALKAGGFSARVKGVRTEGGRQ